MKRFALLVAAVCLGRHSTAPACESYLSVAPAFLQGERLVYGVESIRLAGIGGIVGASGELVLSATPIDGQVTLSLEGTAVADPPWPIDDYTINLEMTSSFDPQKMHSVGFTHKQKTSKGGAEDFTKKYKFDFDEYVWRQGRDTRGLPAKPQDMVSAIAYARSLQAKDLRCDANVYFDKRNNPIKVKSRTGKRIKHNGEKIAVRGVEWDLSNAGSSVSGGAIYLTDDEKQLPVKLEINFSFATIVMRLKE